MEGSIVRAVYEFKSDIEGEMPIDVGDVIQVIEQVDKHWKRGRSSGNREGTFPSGFVVEVPTPRISKGQCLFAAVNDFVEQELGDLTFNRGDVIIGLESIDDNWWKGRLGPNEGIFPITHVWELDPFLIKIPAFPKPMNIPARVKMDLRAQLPDEMDLRKGDIILITEAVDKDWLRGSYKEQTGLVPAAFVTILDEEIQTKPAQPNLLPVITNHNLSSVPLGSNVIRTLPSETPPMASNSTSALKTMPFPTTSMPYNSVQTEATLSSNQSSTFLTSTPTLGLATHKVPSLAISSSTPPASTATSNPWLDGIEDKNYGYDSLNNGIMPFGRTLVPFSGDFPNELSFKSGDVVHLLRHVDDYWMEGEIDGRVGLFPAKYIKIIVDCIDESNGQLLESDIDVISLPSDTYGRVLFDFQAQQNGDLELKAGDTITLLRQLNKDWYEALTDSGRTGLCPANFIEIIGAPQHNNHRDSSLSDSSNQLDCSESIDEDKFSLRQSHVGSWSFTDSSDGSRSSSFSGDIRQSSLDQFSGKSDISPFPRTLKTQMSLPDLATSYSNMETHGMSKSTSLKGSHPRRSAPIVSASKFKDLMEESAPSVTTLQMKNMITEKTEQKRRYERSRDKLKLVVGDETDGSNRDSSMRPGDEEFRRQIVEYEEQIKDLTNEIKELQSQLEMNGTDEEHLKEERVKQLKEEDEQKRKAERKKKDLEQRQCIIMELLQTERDYLQDIKLCHSTFLANPEEAKSLGIDMITLFGNLDEVIEMGNRLFSRLQKCCKDRPAAEQVLGDCFVDLGEDLKEVYGHYCRNHDEIIPLLNKYETVPAIQDFINRRVDKMKRETNCFDLQSVLIKPVQRILKYPMLLNELNKYTEENHIDKQPLTKAVILMEDVAMAINEFKRKKDLVFKYRKGADTSLSSRFSKLTLHSARKKYSRIGVRLSSTFGFTNIAKDEDFAEAEKKFRNVEKTMRIFLKDITEFVAQMQTLYTTVLSIAEDIGKFYRERKDLQEVDQLRSAHRIIFTQYWADFRQSVEKRVVGVLNEVLQMFHGPRNLIQKRNDKLLDYDAAESRLRSNKDTNKTKSIKDEVQVSKQNYEALNSQLVEELPQLCTLSVEILHDSIAQFLCARRIFIGRAAQEALTLMELPSLTGCKGDILEVFKVKHNLVVDDLLQLTIVPRHLFRLSSKLDSRKVSPKTNSSRLSVGSIHQPTVQVTLQSPGQQAYLRSQFSAQSLFVARAPVSGSDLLDISLKKGDIVGVVKKQDPMGNPNRWFVDNGVAKGFVPASALAVLDQSTQPSAQSSPTPSNASSRLSYQGPSKQESSPTSTMKTPPPSYSSSSPQFPRQPSPQQYPRQPSLQYPGQPVQQPRQPSPQFPRTRDSMPSKVQYLNQSPSPTPSTNLVQPRQPSPQFPTTPRNSMPSPVQYLNQSPSPTPNLDHNRTSSYSPNYSTQPSHSTPSQSFSPSTPDETVTTKNKQPSRKPDSSLSQLQSVQQERYCNVSESPDSVDSSKKDLLDLCSPVNRAASPFYNEVKEFDPCSANGDQEVERYEMVDEPQVQHRYEVIPGEEEDDDDSLTHSFYENVHEDGKQPEYYYAMYAFNASGCHQLSLIQGQVVLQHHPCDLHGNPEWWFVEDRYGNQGYVPANYLDKHQG